MLVDKINELFDPLLATLGVGNLDDYDCESYELPELETHRRSALKCARRYLKMLGDDTPEPQVKKINEAHDAFMEFVDNVDGEIAKRSMTPERLARRPILPDGGEDRGLGSDYRRYETKDCGPPSLKRSENLADFVSRDEKTKQSSSIGAGEFLRACVLGAKTESEKRALAEGTDSAGGYTVPTLTSARLIDQMRAQSVVMRAGALTVPVKSDNNVWAKLASDPVPAWRTENSSVAESDPTFGSIPVQPKSLAVMVKVSRELLEDSLNIATALPQILTAALASELDRAALFGNGSGAEPQGVVNAAGIGAVTLNATLDSYTPLITARTTLHSANAESPTAYVLAPRDEGTLASLTDTNGQPISVPTAIAETPRLVTTSVPVNGGTGSDESTIIAGFFPHLAIAMRSEIRIEILRERFADNYQYGFLAYLRADVALEQPGSFCKITGIQP